jgi:hypothetical protein
MNFLSGNKNKAILWLFVLADAPSASLLFWPHPLSNDCAFLATTIVQLRNNSSVEVTSFPSGKRETKLPLKLPLRYHDDQHWEREKRELERERATGSGRGRVLQAYSLNLTLYYRFTPDVLLTLLLTYY